MARALLLLSALVSFLQVSAAMRPLGLRVPLRRSTPLRANPGVAVGAGASAAGASAATYSPDAQRLAPAPPPPGHGIWLPIGSASSLRGLGPTRVEVAERVLAVWEHQGQWHAVSDACPHRLAPLSQGRVEPKSGCIECPYHGWAFSGDGACTRVPQAADGHTGGRPVAAFPTRLVGDVIYAFLEGMGGPHAMGREEGIPEALFPRVKSVALATVRELPYSFDFLVENFLDPAHAPYAHHGVQSLRSDGSPIPITVLVENSTHMEARAARWGEGMRRVLCGGSAGHSVLGPAGDRSGGRARVRCVGVLWRGGCECGA
jgi:nitrite reductase/ring-hydroxylating ferredoxin subunit